MPREIRLDCPVAARCGACQMARLPYAEQLRDMAPAFLLAAVRPVW